MWFLFFPLCTRMMNCSNTVHWKEHPSSTELHLFLYQMFQFFKWRWEPEDKPSGLFRWPESRVGCMSPLWVSRELCPLVPPEVLEHGDQHLQVTVTAPPPSSQPSPSGQGPLPLRTSGEPFLREASPNPPLPTRAWPHLAWGQSHCQAT